MRCEKAAELYKTLPKSQHEQYTKINNIFPSHLLATVTEKATWKGIGTIPSTANFVEIIFYYSSGKVSTSKILSRNIFGKNDGAAPYSIFKGSAEVAKVQISAAGYIYVYISASDVATAEVYY